MVKPAPPLPWLDAGQEFPSTDQAWDHTTPAPGLLAAGSTLDVPTLLDAYSHGVFPWFGEGQPVLWWCPDPRMVLQTQHFRMHRSFRRTLGNFRNDAACQVRFDSCFGDVIRTCASKPREGQPGTWILPSMVEAYIALHQAGYAHSVETWVNGQLTGGLYCVNLGGMVFGESMFAHRSDASKIALAALVAFCRAKTIPMIDCQQNTRHLASLGATEIDRENFTAHIGHTAGQASPVWRFDPVYWNEILPIRTINLP